MAQFLSDEYMTTATEVLANDPGFQGAIGNVDLTIQFSVTEAPDGDVDYGLTIGDGAAVLALGTLDAPEVTVTNDYDTSVAISKGDLNTQMAFMTGKIKVTGNMAALLMHQNVVNQLTTALSTMDVEF